MKIRNGFVSNSSSSSFMIDKRYLSAYQLDQIYNHIEMPEGSCEKGDSSLCHNTAYGTAFPTNDACTYCRETYYKEEEKWSISEDENHLNGYTTMDNFDMDGFLEKIGVPMRKVFWRHS